MSDCKNKASAWNYFRPFVFKLTGTFFGCLNGHISNLLTYISCAAIGIHTFLNIYINKLRVKANLSAETFYLFSDTSDNIHKPVRSYMRFRIVYYAIVRSVLHKYFKHLAYTSVHLFDLCVELSV